MFPAPRVAVPDRARENGCSGSDGDTIINVLLTAAARSEKVVRIVIAAIFSGAGIHYELPRPGRLCTAN